MRNLNWAHVSTVARTDLKQLIQAAANEVNEEAEAKDPVDDGRHTGQQAGCQFFKHAPNREVERIDMDRDAFQRGIDVLSKEGAVAAELLDVSIEQHVTVGHFAAAF